MEALNFTPDLSHSIGVRILHTHRNREQARTYPFSYEGNHPIPGVVQPVNDLSSLK